MHTSKKQQHSFEFELFFSCTSKERDTVSGSRAFSAYGRSALHTTTSDSSTSPDSRTTPLLFTRPRSPTTDT